MPLQILSGKGAVQIMPFRKLGGKFHFFLRFCTRKRSKTYITVIYESRGFLVGVGGEGRGVMKGTLNIII